MPVMTAFCSPQIHTLTPICTCRAEFIISVKGLRSNMIHWPGTDRWVRDDVGWLIIGHSRPNTQGLHNVLIFFNKIKMNTVQPWVYSPFYQQSFEVGFFLNGGKGPWRQRCWGLCKSHRGSLCPWRPRTLHNLSVLPSNSRSINIAHICICGHCSAKSLSSAKSSTQEREQGFQRQAQLEWEFWLLHPPTVWQWARYKFPGLRIRQNVCKVPRTGIVKNSGYYHSHYYCPRWNNWWLNQEPTQVCCWGIFFTLLYAQQIRSPENSIAVLPSP